MDEVRKRYRIDEDRIYLTGHSMGGGGTFRLAVRYPHLWAAIAPMASAGARPFEWLRNLLHIPTLFYHGSEDEVVPVQMAREAANYIRQLGYNFRYEEVEGKPHWWGVDFPEMFAFFAQHRRTKSPDQIAFWTNDPRANRAYWLEIADFDDYTKPASVEAQVTRDKGHGARLILKTENVREVKLRLEDAPEGLKQLPLVVDWNGRKALVTQKSTNGSVRLKFQDPLIGVLVSENESSRFLAMAKGRCCNSCDLRKATKVAQNASKVWSCNRCPHISVCCRLRCHKRRCEVGSEAVATLVAELCTRRLQTCSVPRRGWTSQVDGING
jgi:Predicted peptidase